MIKAERLTKYYGSQPAVLDVSFRVAPGEIVGFLGANGAGKSTTMRMLTGFLTPTSGRAFIDGTDTQENSLLARSKIGYLPESTPLYRDMRVHEFLRYRCRLKGVAYRDEKKTMGGAMELCRITDMKYRIIGHLSKGYRQRVGLADCLLGKPKLLILDEATVGLDPNQVRETRSLIRDIGNERTVFLSTHILNEVELVCSRVIIINQGRIVAEDNTEVLRKRYEKHIKTRELHIEILCKEDPTKSLLKLGNVAEVRMRHREDDLYALTLLCSQGNDPRREVARLVSDRNWLMHEMTLEPICLEDIFAHLTLQNSEAASLSLVGEGEDR